MGIFDALRTGVFAAKVAGCLLDLAIDVKTLDAASAQALFEVERSKSKEFSSQKAALYFLSIALPNLDPTCFLLPIESRDLAQRAEVISNQWLSAGKLRQPVRDAILKSLRRQF